MSPSRAEDSTGESSPPRLLWGNGGGSLKTLERRGIHVVPFHSGKREDRTAKEGLWWNGGFRWTDGFFEMIVAVD